MWPSTEQTIRPKSLQGTKSNCSYTGLSQVLSKKAKLSKSKWKDGNLDNSCLNSWDERNTESSLYWPVISDQFCKHSRKGIHQLPLRPQRIKRRPRPLDECKHLTPHTKLIERQIRTGNALGQPLGPRKLKITHILRGCPNTLGQKATFYPEITKNLMFQNVIFVKNEILKMWIL